MTAPPQNIDAERSIIGTLLAFYTPQQIVIAQHAGLLREDFYRRDNQIIYRAVLNLHARGDHVDPVTVGRFLECQHDEKGVSFLAHIHGMTNLELLTMYSVAHGFRERCLIVHEDARWRRWLYALYTAEEHLHDRDSKRFWEAIESIRPDVLPEAVERPTGLRVVASEEAA